MHEFMVYVMTTQQNTDRATHVSAAAALSALEAAGKKARLWTGNSAQRLYIGTAGDYLTLDSDGDVDIEAIRSCSTISGSQRRWAIYEIIRSDADAPEAAS